MRVLTSLMFSACIALSAGQVRGQQTPPLSNQATEGTTASTQPVQTVSVDAAYKIGPQDVLRVDVWKETEISRTVPVRPDGKISLPLLNDVQAAGLSPIQLANSIATGLKKFITNPQVTVGVTEINSRRIFVTGEVSHAGAFPLIPNMTVLQALSSAGGFTQFARLKNIYVLRMEDGVQVKHPFNYKEAIAGKRPEQNIVLQAGDVIIVP